MHPAAVRFPGQDKLLHLFAYMILGFLWIQAVSRQWPDWSRPRCALIVGGTVVAFGIVVELLQMIVGRTFSVLDMAANGAGVTIGLGVWWWLEMKRQ
jgi:VanZ family protein